MKLIFKSSTYLFFGNTGSEFLTVDRIYDGELTPILYDPNTLQPGDPSYIILCDDGKHRRVDAKYFIPIGEYRDKQLSTILDL